MLSIGSLGHLFVLAAFVFSFIFLFSFLHSEKTEDQIAWYRFGRIAFYFHAFFLLASIVTLYYIILFDRFEYYYAFQHSSTLLPLYYKISSFWEGQEGSFLLWMFWNVLLGFYFSLKPFNKWNVSVMVVFGYTQFILTSMILGVVLFDFKIGSSPFVLLREVVSAPIFSVNPNFIPENGSGLNPLLQNYWMVIHPPTLFLGFAVSIIPFAYAISALRLKDYKQWLMPAKKWLILSIVILGVGIMMGAYWAYETLNFGGYWNWDPVENAVYVPWLFLVAALHSVIITQKNNEYHKMTLILTVTSFVLILYSTFLTRSGILGDSSVHSFTDLGLSGQLLIYLFSFILISIYFFIIRWKEIPKSVKEIKTYSADFWLFIGVLTLILMSFQVIFPTSIPVYNAIIEFFGGFSNLAPPVEKEMFYSNAQIWFASLVAIFSGLAQVLWWRVNKTNNKLHLFSNALLITMFFSASIIISYPINTPSYMILLTASIFSIVCNGSVLLSFLKKRKFISSASVSHIGVAIMLIGILFSSGYSSIESKNYTGLVWNTDFPDEINQDNMLLFVNEQRKIGGFNVDYLGKRKKLKNYSGFINENYLEYIPFMEKHILKKDIEIGGKKLFEKDTVEVDNPDITYFELYFKDQKNPTQTFHLFPKVQVDSNSDMIVFSPDIKNNFFEDLYVHVKTYPDPEEEIKWSEKDSIYVEINQTFFLNDYISKLEKITTKSYDTDQKRFIAEAQIKILASNQEYLATPAYVIDNDKIGLIPGIVDDLGIKVYLSEILPDKELFKISFQTTQKNWVIIEAMQKPLINFMWIGFLILVLGLILSFNKLILKNYD